MWVETIRVLSSAQGVELLKKELNALLRELRDAEGMKDTFIMLHATHAGDLDVVLLWENERRPVQTREGLSIAKYLQQFGSVDHEVWSILHGAAPCAAGAKGTAGVEAGKRQ